MHSIESRCVTGPENNYTVGRHVPTSFSPETVQAGGSEAVKKQLQKLSCKKNTTYVLID